MKGRRKWSNGGIFFSWENQRKQVKEQQDNPPTKDSLGERDEEKGYLIFSFKSLVALHAAREEIIAKRSEAA